MKDEIHQNAYIAMAVAMAEIRSTVDVLIIVTVSSLSCTIVLTIDLIIRLM